jgi:YVTN family beta-propeller protein
MKLLKAPARALVLLLLAGFILTISRPANGPLSALMAQELEPQGQIVELSIDDGLANCAAGPPAALPGQSVKPGFGWVNKLTPTTYPATLRSITIGFNRSGRLVEPNLEFRIVVYIDPEMDGPANGQEPAAAFIGRVRGADTFMTFNLISPLRITTGSFVVGAIDISGVGDFPALFDSPGRSTPPGSQSFISFDSGLSWRQMRDALPANSICGPGSWLIRATVETDPAETLSLRTTLRDPAAVEPWSVAIDRTVTDAIVANLVSDNVTVIKTSSNTFKNLSVGDGPGGTPDGPFGVAFHPNSNRAYVTLFGSDIVPTREFPVDYSTVGAGRVAVLVKQQNGDFTQSLQVNVGKGPRFPAILPDGSKLYVPCGGVNTVDVINTTTNERIRSIPAGTDPSSCTVSFDGGKLYVTNYGSNSITVIDTRTDQVIKTIANLIGSDTGPAGPWMGDISPLNGNLYVTVRDINSTGVPTRDRIIEIDTCSDTVIRQIVDPATSGTPVQSPGSTGIPAPAGPLVRDPATGLTPGAGGGGGGPFGIASCIGSPSMVFTNDGLGIVGALDTRIDQIISATPLTSCPKPRGLDCVLNPATPPPNVQPGHLAYVACGQPDNSVLVIGLPGLPENISSVPVIEAVSISANLRITGKGFKFVDRIEVIVPGSSACLTFNKQAKFKKEGKVILQKGKLSDGRSLTEAVAVGATLIIRVVNLDGSIRLIRLTRTA